MAALNTATIAQLDDVLADFDLIDSAPAAPPLTLVPSTPVVASHVVLANPPTSTDLDVFYKPMDRAQAEELQAVAARIRDRDRAARAAILDIGHDLIKIKDGMSGHFDKWLKLEFDMSKATAWNYINAAEKFGSAPKVVEVLPPVTVYKLAAKATPDVVRKAVVLEIENGAKPTRQDVEGRIADARYQAAEARREEQKQAAAERQKKADEAAWQEKAQELADEGKTEAEIERIKKKWNSAKAAKLRAKERAAAKLEAENKKWQEEREVENERMERLACSLANWLLEALGGEKFEELRRKLPTVELWRLAEATDQMTPNVIAITVAKAEKSAEENAANIEADRVAAETAITEAGNASVAFGAF